jgi:hypothetical protein
MKKLLVLVLVLGLASLAGAAQIWNYSGSTAVQNDLTMGYDVNPGDVITMTLSNNAAQAAGINIDVITDNGAAGFFSAISLNALFNVGDNKGITGAALDAMLAGYELPASGVDAGDLALIGVAVGGGMVAANGAVLTLNYTVGANAGLVTINGLAVTVPVEEATWQQGLNQVAFSGTEGNQALSPIQMNVIPEPATMVILAIGGLLIRRK